MGKAVRSRPEDTVGDRSIASRVWVCVRSPISRDIRSWMDLYSYSPLAGSLNKIEDHSGRKIRIFFSRELLNRLSINELKRIEIDLFDRLLEIVEAW